jgi:hypothetical protein
MIFTSIAEKQIKRTLKKPMIVLFATSKPGLTAELLFSDSATERPKKRFKL